MYSENWLENNCVRQDLERRYRRADEVWRFRRAQGTAGRKIHWIGSGMAVILDAWTATFNLIGRYI